MKKKLLLIALMGCFATSFGQVINTFPYNQDFEGEGASTLCNGYTMLSPGWFNDNTDNNDWVPDANGTTSSLTGPSVDYNPGTTVGKYMYTETSGCQNDVRNLETPWFDFTGLTSLEMSFAYHMYGGTMGTMSVDYRISSAGAWTNLVPPMTDNLNQWQLSMNDITFLAGNDSVKFRFVANTGTSFESDMAIDDFSIVETTFQANIINVQDNACFGQNLGSMTVDDSYGIQPVTYAWDNGDTTATITGLAAGTYCCVVTDAAMNTIVVCDDIVDLGTSPLVVDAHTTGNWFCKDSLGMLVIDTIYGGTQGAANCGVLGLACSGVEDTIQTETITGFNTSTGYPAPLGNWYWGTRHQMSYTAFDLLAAGVQPGNLSGMAFFIDSTLGFQGSTQALSSWTIKIGCSSDSVMSTFDNVPLDEVYPPTDITLNLGWNWFTFPTAFYWNGVDNIIIQTCFNNSSYTDNSAIGYANKGYNACIAYYGDNSTACSNSSVFVTSFNRPVARFKNCSAAPAYSYLYSWDNGSAADTTYVPEGTYTLTVTDGVGCVDTSNVITMNESQPVNVDDMQICLNNPNDLIATPGFTTYNWNTGETTGTISVSTGGWFFVDATDSLGCPTTDSAFISTIPSPILAASSGDESYGSDGSISLSIYGNAYPFTVDWDNDGTGDNDDPESIFNLTAGDYTVVVTDTNGCYATLTITVDSRVGIEENGSIFNIYPNPTTGLFYIQPLNIVGDNVSGKVMDAAGRVITNISFVGNDIVEVDLSDFERGIYFINITVDGNTTTTKIIRE